MAMPFEQVAHGHHLWVLFRSSHYGALHTPSARVAHDLWVLTQHPLRMGAPWVRGYMWRLLHSPTFNHSSNWILVAANLLSFYLKRISVAANLLSFYPN